MSVLVIKKRLVLSDRIRQILIENAGQFYGFHDLVKKAETSNSALRYQLQRMVERGEVRLLRAPGGRTHKTKIELIKTLSPVDFRPGGGCSREKAKHNTQNKKISK